MAVGLALVLSALSVAGFAINLYFLALLHNWSGLRCILTPLFRACGVDASTCSSVVQTPYARLFGGMANAWVGVAWNVALLALAIDWWRSGALHVPWPYVIVAALSVVVGAYLVYVLKRILKLPCPLCMTSHALHGAIAILLITVHSTQT